MPEPLLRPGAPSREEDQYVRWASLPYDLLIVGETGTGKTRLARSIHAWSGRPGSCQVVSLAELTDELAGSELFGHVKGAFTGADRERKGAFELADGGTLVLDEVDKCTLSLQGKLLRAVEEKKIVRLGDRQEIPVDIRLIAVTNADLESLVEEGQFLGDLRARFGYYVIRMRPLREQRPRILGMARYFLETEAKRIKRGAAPTLTPETAAALEHARWGRNIRELLDVCRYVAGNAGEFVRMADLPAGFLVTLGIDPSKLEEPIRERARRVIAECAGNKSLAARRLGMSRGRLYRLFDTSTL